MELLPPSVDAPDPAFIIDMDSGHNIDTSGLKRLGGGGNTETSECYSLLRDIYAKIHGENAITAAPPSTAPTSKREFSIKYMHQQQQQQRQNEDFEPADNGANVNTVGNSEIGGNKRVGDGILFDIERELSILRMPFEHLRTAAIDDIGHVNRRRRMYNTEEEAEQGYDEDWDDEEDGEEEEEEETGPFSSTPSRSPSSKADAAAAAPSQYNKSGSSSPHRAAKKSSKPYIPPSQRRASSSSMSASTTKRENSDADEGGVDEYSNNEDTDAMHVPAAKASTAVGSKKQTKSKGASKKKQQSKLHKKQQQQSSAKTQSSRKQETLVNLSQTIAAIHELRVQQQQLHPSSAEFSTMGDQLFSHIEEMYKLFVDMGLSPEGDVVSPEDVQASIEKGELDDEIKYLMSIFPVADGEGGEVANDIDHPSSSTLFSAPFNAASFQELVGSLEKNVARVAPAVAANSGSSTPKSPSSSSSSSSSKNEVGSGLSGSSGWVFELSESSPTCLIAQDLEDMLLTFVQSDKAGQASLLAIVRNYYDELDMYFPEISYNEYAANMDLGLIYIEVMDRVVSEGPDFISPELDRWQQQGALLLAQARARNGGGDGSLYNPNNDLSIAGGGGATGLGSMSGGSMSVDQMSQEALEFELDLADSYFNSFSLADRVSCSSTVPSPNLTLTHLIPTHCTH